MSIVFGNHNRSQSPGKTSPSISAEQLKIKNTYIPLSCIILMHFHMAQDRHAPARLANPGVATPAPPGNIAAPARRCHPSRLWICHGRLIPAPRPGLRFGAKFVARSLRWIESIGRWCVGDGMARHGGRNRDQRGNWGRSGSVHDPLCRRQFRRSGWPRNRSEGVAAAPPSSWNPWLRKFRIHRGCQGRSRGHGGGASCRP